MMNAESLSLSSHYSQVQEPMLFILTMYLALVYGIICKPDQKPELCNSH